jgi:hypothetical protein
MAPERSPEIFTGATEYDLQLMEERLNYEQLIGEKLQSLPIPDMQDAIWARIKSQLDIDMPTDDSDGGNTPHSPSGPGIIGWGLSVIIVALVASFFILKNKPKTKDFTTNPSTTNEQIVSPSVQNNSPPAKDNTIKNVNVPVNTNNNSSVQATKEDSFSQQDFGYVNPIADSANTNLSPPLVTLTPPKTDTTSQVKKGKGMKGLSDSSYRIVPKNKN